MNKFYYCIFLIALHACRYTASAQAGDFSSCTTDLDTLMRSVSDASYEAQEVEASEAELQFKKEKLDECSESSDILSRRRDQCRGILSAYYLALNNYKYALDNFENEINHITGRLRSIRATCDLKSLRSNLQEIEIFRGRNSLESQRDTNERLQLETSPEKCAKSMTAEECNRRIELK